jgi:hypothetical protein
VVARGACDGVASDGVHGVMTACVCVSMQVSMCTTLH